METFYMQVGFTTTRPVIPDEHMTNVVVATDGGIHDARLAAAQWIGCGTGVEMVTRVDVLFVEI